MKINKKTSVILSLFLVMLNINTMVYSRNEKTIKLAQIENVKLSGIVDYKKDSYKINKFLIENNKNKKYFKWHAFYNTNSGWNPKLELIDLNNDSKKEIVVMTTLGEGTGFYKGLFHIVNPYNLKEIAVENPMAFLKKHIKNKIYNNYAELNIDNHIYNIKYKKIKGVDVFKKLYFGDYISYYIKDKKLYVNMGAEIYRENYLGNVVVEYKYSAGMFRVNKITFEKTRSV